MAKGEKRGPGAISRIIGLVRPRMGSYLPGFIAFTLTEAVFYVAIPYVMKLMIDAAIAKDLAGLWKGVAFILAVSGIGAVSFVLFQYLFCVAVYKITADIRKKGFGRALALSARYFESTHSGDILSRLTNDVNTLRNAYDWPLWGLAVTLVTGAGAAAMMIILDWRVSLVLLASSLGFTLLNMRFSESIKRISEKIQASAGKITESTGNILAGHAVIRQFRLRELMIGRFEGHNRETLDRSKERAFKSAWLEAYNSLIGWLNFGGVLALGAFLAGKKLMSFGTMVALVNYLWNVNRMIRETGRGIAGFQGYLAGEARVAELGREEAEPAEPDPERFSRAEDGEGGAGGEIAIRMRDLRFSYDGKREALSGLDLVARRGQTIALVGPSGGGKSTVVKLLLGFYRPSGGELSLGGLESGRTGIAELRELMAYVPQDPFMFDGTVAENIGYGRSGASREEIEAAARSACAHDFILGLEKGYDTLVGERGVKLSGGQRQRIAIARAFIKDAPILLMDEATSSLDSQSELRIQEALRGLGGKKTVVLIAHRLSTIEDADRIYVIDRGRAVEEGRHAELLARGGLYRKLHEMQFRLEDEGEGRADA